MTASLNQNQVRERLEKERARLVAELDQFKASESPDERREGSPFGKREEEATETLELEKRLAMERRNKEMIAEVDRALAKLEKGTYGLCDICGQAIDPARLDALPQATLCLKCKSQAPRYAKGKPTAG